MGSIGFRDFGSTVISTFMGAGVIIRNSVCLHPFVPT